jgi:hypothetical protein
LSASPGPGEEKTVKVMNQKPKLFPLAVAQGPLPWFLLGVTVVLYLRLFIPPFTPILLGGDQSFFLTNAVRMFNGQVMYRDFFQFTPAGTNLVYLALFKLFGQRAWIPNLAALVLGVGMTWLTVFIARGIVRTGVAFLAGLLFLTFAYVYILDATHHRYSMLAVAAAVAAIIETRSLARIAAAGVLCGAASFFTQSRGAVAVLGISVFLLWENLEKQQRWTQLLKRLAILDITFVSTIFATNAYFIWKGGLARVAYCQVTFFLKYLPVSGYYMVELPAVPPWHNLPKLVISLFIHALLPLIYVLYFARYYRQSKARPLEHWDRLMLVSIVGLFLFLEVVPAANWIRLFGVAPPALIVFVWFVSGPGRLPQALVRSLWVIVLTLAIAEPWWTQHHRRDYLDLPVGRAAFLDEHSYQEFAWLLHRTRPSDFFFEGAAAGFYFPLGLRNPAYVDKISPTSYTRPQQVENVIQSLQNHHVRLVLWSAWLDAPADTRGAEDHLGPLRAYLRSRYHLVKTLGEYDEVWERNQ